MLSDDLAAFIDRVRVLEARLAELEKPPPPPDLFAQKIPGTLIGRGASNVTYLNGQRHVTLQPSTDGFTGYGVAERGYLTDAGITPGRRCTLSYEVFIPADFNPYEGGKLPSLFGQPVTRPFFGADGMSSATVYHDDSFWPGIMWAGPSEMTGTWPNRVYKGDANLDHIRVQPYVYCNLAPDGTTGDQMAARHAGWYVKLRQGITDATITGSGPYLYLKRGAWNTLTQTVVLNDKGKANGELTMTVNGTLGLHARTIRWVADTANDTATINGLHLDTFAGGPHANVTAQRLAFRHLKIT